jgi:DNA polymerase I-like protein with 3'-5' exonuclease and polymerase domains
MTTEEYIRSPEFEVIGVAVQEEKQSPVWFSGTRKNIKEFLDWFDWDNSAVIAHNAMFDLAILNWHFDINPKKIVDTLSMARAIHGTEVGGSLAALAVHYRLGTKGTDVLNALGKRRIDFTAQELISYGEYCKNDAGLTYGLFWKLMGEGFPVSELDLIDLTMRMFVDPVIELDVDVLTGNLQAVQTIKAQLLHEAMTNKEQLMSNDRLAELLWELGVISPTKISPTTQKSVFAFARSDEEFQALLEHENFTVQALVAARLGVKSTIEETRTERLISIAGRGLMPIPLRYYAAHTGRWGGDDKVNMQNLPRKSPLKYALRAPKGYAFIDCDSSQIEARTLAWLSGQADLVQAFEKGEDVYRIMAASIYWKPQEEITKDERFVGKTTVLGCLAEGTLVLCGSGWKPIELVSLDDKVWDGGEWVCHQGLMRKGCKETLNLSGVWLTPDHKVLCGTQWLEAQSVVRDLNILSLALGTGTGNLPSRDTSNVLAEVKEVGYRRSLLAVSAGGLSTQLTGTISKTLNQLGATSALKNLRYVLESCIGDTQKFYRRMSTGSGCLTGFRAVSLGAIQKLVGRTRAMVGGVSLCTPRGGKIGPSFYATLLRSLGGKKRSSTLTALTTAKGMNPITYDLQLGLKMRGTNARLASSSRNLMTYDLAYAGPRNRFTVLSDQGPLIVHNCGYGMGYVKFGAQLQALGVVVDEKECERIISVYRGTYTQIPKLWTQANHALLAMLGNKTTELGLEGVLAVEGKRGIRLPNGLYLKYPNLRWKTDASTGKNEMVYDVKKGKSVVVTRIYGGKLVENICQALARIIIGEQMLAVSKKQRVVMTVHDAIGCVVPEAEAQTGLEFVEACMRIRPTWAQGLPLNCEGGSGATYGDC